MGLCYYFYNADTGERIDSGKYADMPFFNDKDYGMKHCAIDVNYITDKIIKWTTDKNSELFKDYFNYYNCQSWTEYIDRECAEKMQRDMNGSTLFTDLMNENKCNALIMNTN